MHKYPGYILNVLPLAFALFPIMASPAFATPIYEEEVAAAQSQVDADSAALDACKAEYEQAEQEFSAIEESARSVSDARDKAVVEMYKASSHKSLVLEMLLSCTSAENFERLVDTYYTDISERYSQLLDDMSLSLLEAAAEKESRSQAIAETQAKLDASLEQLESAKQVQAKKEAQLAKITAAQTNADMARTFCSIAYSRQVRHDPSTGAYPGTAMFVKAYDAIWWSRGDASWPSGKVHGRACDRGVSTAVVLSGFDDDFPRSCGELDWGQWAYLTSSPRWEDLGLWSGKESDLEPGDVLLRVKGSSPKATSDHVCMYVGHDIIMEVYENVLKGTDADVGVPDAKAAWVSSSFSNGLSGGDRGRAPGMGKDGDSTMNVFRCVNPQYSNKYAHVLD